MTGRTGGSAGAYPPIGEYCFLSDCHTASLVGPDAAVEWLCAPRFDSASVFARMLDRAAGGAWELALDGTEPREQRYLDGTLVLETRWTTPSGTAVGHDFLAARQPDGDRQGIEPRGTLVRLLHCESGEVRTRHRLDVRPGDARTAARWSARHRAGDETGGAAAASGALVEEETGLCLAVAGGADGGESVAPTLAEDGSLVVDAVLTPGATLAVSLGLGPGSEAAAGVDGADRLLRETAAAWRAWSSAAAYEGYGARHVRHSAVVLRGLMASATGALIAAPTTSLPEWPGGERNWDYRFLWQRDAALVVLVLMRLHHRAEAGAYLRLLLRHCAVSRGVLTPMLDIDGSTESSEHASEHLDGYLASRPVRYGNEAFRQHQLDTYGQVLDAALVHQQVTGTEGQGLDEAELGALFAVVDRVCRVRHGPDDGIWEVRNLPRNWTSSRLYAWVCLDRGIRLAELAEDGRPQIGNWRAEREALRREILTHGYDEERGAFVQSYGSRNLDASLLHVSLVGFLEGTDPRVVSTIDRIDEELGEDGWLVHRYDPQATDDGLNGPEGGFLLCSFDMVSALVLAGRRDEARRRFEALCSRRGRFGLFSEEMTAAGQMLGNYPQAFTHLGLIEAAMNLDAADDSEALHAWATRTARSGG
ncbi:glycoside hydrolase family 15 protein [Streptomyces xiaopingdaonensis]|uniref:glycoside hydrolase family 15 protein n=1 Tax=Streptomyces xiaopingdaonensis TaxID=1565415 RepID=UPI0002D407EE|nr:glycoside hydrolase family 15 protein [Streptomyces xiaopingdaonensis]